MTQDEIIEMARQVRFGTPLTHDGELGHFINGADYLEELVTFAKLVAEKEREKCAKMCAEDGVQAMDFTGGTFVGGYFSKKIIDRGET